MEDYDTPVGGDTAVFNMGIETLRRMNEILKDCNICARTWRLHLWFSALWALRLEIIPYLKDQEKLDLNTKINILKKTHNTYQSKSRINPATKYAGDFFESLTDTDIYIRELMNEHGLLMPKGSDPRFAAYDI